MSKKVPDKMVMEGLIALAVLLNRANFSKAISKVIDVTSNGQTAHKKPLAFDLC